MTFDEMRADVRMALGVMPTSSKWVTGGHIDRAINAAQQYVILLALGGNRAGMNLFPELETEWLGTTGTGFDYVTMPSNKLAIQKAYSFDRLGADPRVDRAEREIALLPYNDYIGLPRDSTRVGFPRMGAWRARRLYLNPTTTVAYLTDLWLVGLKKPDDLVLGTDVPLLDPEWHPILVTEAQSRMAAKMRWFDEQKAWRQQVIEEVGSVTDPKALAEYLADDPIELEFSANAMEVYG